MTGEKKIIKKSFNKKFPKKKINNDNDDNKKESCVCCQPAEWIQGIFFLFFFLSFTHKQTKNE